MKYSALALVMWVIGVTGASGVNANVIDPELSGVKQYDGWAGLTFPNYPGYGSFPGEGNWPAPIVANQPGSGDAKLEKLANGVSGGPYPASGTMYFGGMSLEVNIDGGQLGMEDETPVEGVVNVVAQIRIAEAWTYDFWNDEPPVLTYNGGTVELEPVYTTVIHREFAGTIEMPSGVEDLYINTHLVQWDLRGVTGPITDFEVSFHGVQHAQLHELRLDQSDVYVSLAPEPVCPADFNGDDVRDVADLFAYINAWLAKTPNADFNDDTTVDVADLFAYINAWLAGC